MAKGSIGLQTSSFERTQPSAAASSEHLLILPAGGTAVPHTRDPVIDSGQHVGHGFEAYLRHAIL